MMRCLRKVGAGSLVATVLSLMGCGATGQLPAGQPSQASLLLEQAKKNHCTAPCIYVANEQTSSVNIYPLKANGNVAPAGSLSGSNTKLSDVWGVGFDASNNIYVANYSGGAGFGSVTEYTAGSRGNVAPIAQITGPSTGDTMLDPSDVAVDAAGDIYVPGYISNTVSVYAAGANGSSAPIRYLSGSNTALDGPSYDYVTAKGKLYVANFAGQSVNVYAPGANGNVAPVALITGTNTGIYHATGVAVDAKGRIYVSSDQQGTPAGCCVTVFAKNANGNATPIQQISGAQSGLTGPDGISVDSNDNIYITQYPPNGGTPSVAVFKKGANGDVPPIRTIVGSKTGLDGPAGITVH